MAAYNPSRNEFETAPTPARSGGKPRSMADPVRVYDLRSRAARFDPQTGERLAPPTVSAYESIAKCSRMDAMGVPIGESPLVSDVVSQPPSVQRQCYVESRTGTPEHNAYTRTPRKTVSQVHYLGGTYRAGMPVAPPGPTAYTAGMVTPARLPHRYTAGAIAPACPSNVNPLPRTGLLSSVPQGGSNVGDQTTYPYYSIPPELSAVAMATVSRMADQPNAHAVQATLERDLGLCPQLGPYVPALYQLCHGESLTRAPTATGPPPRPLQRGCVEESRYRPRTTPPPLVDGGPLPYPVNLASHTTNSLQPGCGSSTGGTEPERYDRDGGYRPHHDRAPVRKECRVNSFDGKTEDFRVFLAFFEEIALGNQWDSITKKLRLVESFKGHAREVCGSIDLHSETYESLRERLMREYHPAGSCNSAKRQFGQRMRSMDKENPNEYMRALEHLSLTAFPGDTAERRSKEVCEQFVFGHPVALRAAFAALQSMDRAVLLKLAFDIHDTPTEKSRSDVDRRKERGSRHRDVKPYRAAEVALATTETSSSSELSGATDTDDSAPVCRMSRTQRKRASAPAKSRNKDKAVVKAAPKKVDSRLDRLCQLLEERFSVDNRRHGVAEVDYEEDPHWDLPSDYEDGESHHLAWVGPNDRQHPPPRGRGYPERGGRRGPPPGDRYASRQPRSEPSKRRCGYCGKPNHNHHSCYELDRDIAKARSNDPPADTPSKTRGSKIPPGMLPLHLRDGKVQAVDEEEEALLNG